jgi:uncharacterized OsmC-like protein
MLTTMPDSATLLYTSQVAVVPGDGPDKIVSLAAEPDPLVMGAHGALAERLGVPPNHREHASTLDYVVAAAVACMSGTFVRALRARGVDPAPDCYRAEGFGDIHVQAQVPVLERIEIHHVLTVGSEFDELVNRVHDVYKAGCAVSRSIAGAIDIESKLSMQPAPGHGS